MPRRPLLREAETDFDRDLSDRWAIRWLGGLMASLVLVALLAYVIRRFL